MKTYHICRKETVNAYRHLFCPRDGVHYLDLPDGEVLVCANFSNESSEQHWNEAKGVESLPHPMYEGTQPISTKHHKKLKHLGVDSTHTVIDVARIAGANHPLLRLVRFSRP